MGKVVSISNIAPRLADKYMERSTFKSQKTDIAISTGRPDNLFNPVENDGGERGGNWHGRVMKRSVYTAATLHPGTTAIVATALGVALAAGFGFRRRSTAGHS
jgi:hypothetical protein